ncbi:MAG: hypothetical protein K0M40_10595 [Prolixibacteraceae bacterium]|nr:hypothetical protein [Prolixibacteraceae bacterium]
MNTFQKIFHIYANSERYSEFSGQVASDLIKTELLANKPSMIARMGSTELQGIAYCIDSQKSIKKHLVKWKEDIVLSKMSKLSGFFPSTLDNLHRFTKLMIEDAKQVDIFGSWRQEEIYLQNELRQAKRIRLRDLEPYYHENPWSEALKNKKVLVIHPFEKSIINQFQHRESLFENKIILPEFGLQTIKSVQSVLNIKPEFDNWFLALESMKNQINSIDFDIALIGCGAYGFPLAAHVKRKGKKSVLLGGSLQILFGIKGKRWDEHPQISKLYNDYWTRPDLDEKPVNSRELDGGSYW